MFGLLRTRRTKDASDLADEGLITPEEARQRLDGYELDAIEVVALKPSPGQHPLAIATPASSGVAIGAAVFDPARALELARSGKPVILMRETAETGDVRAIAEAEGLVTREGARTSHAAVVARQLGKVCVVGCTGLEIDPAARTARLGASQIAEGEIVSVDGARGEIFRGAVDVIREHPTELIDKMRAPRGTARHRRSPRASTKV